MLLCGPSTSLTHTRPEEPALGPEQDDDNSDDDPAPLVQRPPPPPPPQEQQYADTHSLNDWTKIISVTGKPGTGKTRCMHGCIKHLLRDQRKTLVATPTGFLASSYRALFDDALECNTVHASFSYPIDDTPPHVNWLLANFDVIIIDEISMIPAKIFHHILDTLQQLATRPVVLICGDQYQQQPIHTVAGRITNTDNIYADRHFASMTTTHNFLAQHRCNDQAYTDILAHIRHWRPTRSILNTLHAHGRLLHDKAVITDQDILNTIDRLPLATFVTVSKRASHRVNDVLLRNYFKADESLGLILMDGEETGRDLFQRH